MFRRVAPAESVNYPRLLVRFPVKWFLACVWRFGCPIFGWLIEVRYVAESGTEKHVPAAKSGNLRVGPESRRRAAGLVCEGPLSGFRSPLPHLPMAKSPRIDT